MSSTHRTDFTAGLRALADYLDANPGVPVPEFSAAILIHIYGTDDEQRIEVDRVAELLGVSVLDDHRWPPLQGDPVLRPGGVPLCRGPRRCHGAPPRPMGLRLFRRPRPGPGRLMEPDHYECCTCGGQGLDSHGETCRHCHGQGFC
jgi:hypothetical protein